MSGNVVLVTGGAGFIGSHTADALMSRGDAVIIVDNLNDFYDPQVKRDNISLLIQKHGERKCKVYIGDITNRELIRFIFENEQPNLICHLAARAGVRPSIEDPFAYVHSNIEGTLVLLEETRKHLPNITNFVYASSSSVYGNATKFPLNEMDAALHSVSPYAATKAACEALVHSYSSIYGLPSAGLRFFTVYGPRGRPDMAVYTFIDRIFKGLSIDQYGDGSSYRDYTYVDDIVRGVLGALDNPRSHEVYNLGNGNPFKLTDMIAIIEKALNRKAIVNIMDGQKGDVNGTFADIEKARKLLNYDPKVSLRDGLFNTVEWYLNIQKKKEAFGFKSYSKICNSKKCIILQTKIKSGE